MDIHGIIFDLDGVICSTDELNYQSWKTLADRLGIPFDRSINNRCRGVSRLDSLNILLEKASRRFSDAEKDELCREKNKVYLSHIASLSPNDVSLDTKNTLFELKKRGYKLAIGSSSKNTKAVLKQIGLSDFFDAVADGNEISKAKPDPEIFLLAASKIKEAPMNCLVIEDAYAGIEAANRGNFVSVGISDARNDKTAKFHILKLSDLLEIVK